MDHYDREELRRQRKLENVYVGLFLAGKVW
ncbi:hypothetical protein ACVI1K_005100 [Bradyrhizobium sp. USDA 4508]